ncbi:MAG: MATE family efflux transporter, partial [Clostridiales bacterium]|nr:MATE family efflux transporter [Clostridiales bacterium]
LTGATVFLLKSPFISMYQGVSPETAAICRQFCNVLAVTSVGSCYQAACLFGLVKSGGDIDFVFRNDTIFVLLVVLPSAIIASRLGAPAWVVFACLKCDQILKCIVAFFKINSFNWMHNLTRDTDKSGEPA